MSNPPIGNSAVLLLGPPASGKSPLGDLIAERGLWRKPCLHFDFGSNLRRIVKRNRPDQVVDRNELDFLKRVLQSGALLENDHFPIAERVLRSYLDEQGAEGETMIVLNGLPRHVGQAEALAATLEVVAVVYLWCPAETVLQRIRTNVGGDRGGREDDDLESIQNKLTLFEARTVPLLEHYRKLDARIEVIHVTENMTPEDAWETLERHSRC